MPANSKTEGVVCTLCELRHSVKAADAWCNVCQKGFCNKCRYSHLSNRKHRTHRFISVDKHFRDTAPESVICKAHENKSHYFCKTHNEVYCVVCKPEAHKTCEGLATLHDASKDVKLSTISSTFDKTIKSLTGNIQKAIANRTKNLTSLKETKKKVEDEITNIRNQINEQLDKAQEEMINDLNKTYMKQKFEVEECLKTLEKGRTEMTNIKEEAESLSLSPSSNVHNFLKSLQMTRKFKEEENRIIEAIKASKPITISLKLAPALQTFLEGAVSFGSIETTKKNGIGKRQSLTDSKTPPKSRNAPRSAVIQVGKFNIEFLQNVKRPTGNESFVKSCAFKSDGQIVFIEPENKVLATYDKKGVYVNSIAVSGHPFDIALINYCTVALTFEKQNTIQILDLTYNKVSKSVHAKGRCRGICYMNGQLFVVVKDVGIVILNTLGQVKKTLPVDVTNVRFLAASNSRLCYTDEDRSSVVCCDQRGKEIWRYNEKNIGNPQGITLDSFGNAFVLGISESSTGNMDERTYQLTLVFADGSGSKIVLKRPGLPSGIDHDKKYKRLVLYNLDGSADLYSVNLADNRQ